ncbi:uncharacterized protein BP5553_08722 [Venustampulla echinocandica]|uniref:Meiotically up-regulated protein Msb1/Mug8 domain-containing protein n=1 Tax=Venustampulla echinocandica TaxID=2656787 RepID=A0A370TF17_9HELO|nr:uncharacterized protein BP5553_08722 [Venustampulla echinocandica]RDL33283.1 hypothetical protein BP5553_08722 [Venustampulla echinocandica]
MPSFFSRLKGKDGPTKASKKKGAQQTDLNALPPKPQWEDAWTRKTVDPEEVQELLRGCTVELKSRAMEIPLSLLPFRPTSDPSAARTFIRHFFDRDHKLYGEGLAQELRLTEPMVLCSVVKWCWSRLPGGVVTWDAYELFRVGESDSNMARDAFATFIPLSVDSDARTKIIFDFFDLLSAIVAHAKTNGFGGRKLSRLAGWWAFEHSDNKNGFEGGYNTWIAAADAASHLFFAYLRSLSPQSVGGMNGISSLPISLQKLLQETEYPPQRPALLQSTTTKVVMIVDAVSPTPFALLRRANHFQYRDDDRALKEFAEYEDPVKALTDECRRVLRCISSANQSQVSNSKNSTGLRDASWSRFEDIGFSGGIEENEEVDEESNFMKRRSHPHGLRTTPHYKNVGLARPTTPSWADFLSSGFVDEAKAGPAPLLLPPDKILPPIDTRGRSSQSHRPRLETESILEPGELASINKFDLDDSFWWVWITSLAGEETPERKAAFGRCALIETVIRGGRWLVMEEVVKGAAAEPAAGAYIAEKKSFWGRTKKNKARRKSTGKEALEQQGALQPFKTAHNDGTSKVSVGPDQHARIQAAAIQLQQKQRQQEAEQQKGLRRGRADIDTSSQKTNSVFTLQPVIMSEASPAMKWANKYDKDAIREAYLANSNTGRGTPEPMAYTNGHNTQSQDTLRPAQNLQRANSRDRDLPSVPSSAGPAVPSKLSSPSAPTPVAKNSKEQSHWSEKATEAALPADTHPAVAGPSLMLSPMPHVTQPPIEQHPAVARSASPLPSVEQPSLDISRPSEDTHVGGSSPESKAKHNKLRKKELGGEPRGFRKIFGRKNRQSMVPENAPELLNGPQGSLQPAQPGGIGRRLSHLRKKSPPAAPAASPTPTTQPPRSAQISENEITPIASPQPQFERSYDPSVRESLSRVDTNDAREARQAFSNFDQGPLDDVPAFVPDSPAVSDDSAAPPNISRSHEPEVTTSPLTQEASPPQDRWAQIRKNAAERAAVRQSEEQSRGGHSQKTDGEDGETSGEETIESRVARIKARVAELTGNMESNGSPTSQSPGRKPTGY